MFTPSTAHFLLDFLWAAGLANRNRLLSHGPMARAGMLQIAGYASTGGWTLGALPPMQVYGQLDLVPLDSAQQGRLEEAAAGIYRPCCDNPTSFPDCNHGMAMVGLLTLLAAEGRDTDALFRAARIANAHWFAQEWAQVSTYVQAARGVDVAALDPREASGRALFSGSGARAAAAWLARKGIRPRGSNARC